MTYLLASLLLLVGIGLFAWYHKRQAAQPAKAEPSPSFPVDYYATRVRVSRTSDSDLRNTLRNKDTEFVTMTIDLMNGKQLACTGFFRAEKVSQ